jgi:lipopolysaccharide transport system ATP-binding protein
MYVRLAFAVAAHLEPEILIVDEVLAVGDAQFQKKCLGKMEDVSAKEGRTVLFVSHNMEAISRLCTKGLLLNAGKVVTNNIASEVIKAYLESNIYLAGEKYWSDISTAPGDDSVRLHSIKIEDDQGKVTSVIDIQKPVNIILEIINLKAGAKLVPNLHFYNDMGVNLFTSAFNHDSNSKSLPGGLIRFACSIPGNFFAGGHVSITANVSSIEPVNEVHVSVQDAVSFNIEDTGGVRGNYPFAWPGVVRPMLKWKMDV